MSTGMLAERPDRGLYASLHFKFWGKKSSDSRIRYVTWNISRGSRAWDCCAVTVIHIPELERSPD